MEDEKYMIPIPANVKIRMEIIDGIGMKELIEVCVAGILSALFAYIIYIFAKNYIVSVGIFLAVTALTFLLVKKDRNNQSFAGIFGNMLKFFAGQRFFKYVYNEINIISGGKKE